MNETFHFFDTTYVYSLHVNFFNQPEISGSASRLGRLVAYHHFTLLFHSKLQQLAQMLTPHTNGLRSNATASVRSSVINLSQINNAITYDNLCSKIASTFTKTFHPKINNEELLDINPSTESNYPGIASLRNEMKSWDWIYGKTPDFEIHQSSNLSMGKVTISVVIRKGIISEIKLDVSKAIPSAIIDEISSGLVGCRYGTEDVSGIVYYLEAKSDGMNSRTRTAELIRWLMIILGRN
ncbi:Lipoyltransferase 1, mitochondrial [Trichoplax sp. H2]|nr:Lipoyltransferase 1, mitochondrial [Trichoplax sp. H2]|eukprot:RDD41543.1 Lipoyltransferase 1, mitochondrial [Trichoplax sp. H2]